MAWLCNPPVTGTGSLNPKRDYDGVNFPNIGDGIVISPSPIIEKFILKHLLKMPLPNPTTDPTRRNSGNTAPHLKTCENIVVFASAWFHNPFPLAHAGDNSHYVQMVSIGNNLMLMLALASLPLMALMTNIPCHGFLVYEGVHGGKVLPGLQDWGYIRGAKVLTHVFVVGDNFRQYCERSRTVAVVHLTIPCVELVLKCNEIFITKVRMDDGSPYHSTPFCIKTL